MTWVIFAKIPRQPWQSEDSERFERCDDEDDAHRRAKLLAARHPGVKVAVLKTKAEHWVAPKVLE